MAAEASFVRGFEEEIDRFAKEHADETILPSHAYKV